MPGKFIQDCDPCQPCKQGCCCTDIEFQVCASLSDCTPPDELPPNPPNCMYVGTLFFGWAAIPQCILDMADGEDVVYDIFLDECPVGMTGTPDFTVTNPPAVSCGNPAYGIGRPVWAGAASQDCGNCLPNVCLRVSAAGVVLTRCTVCPEMCDIPCSSSSSSSSSGSSVSSSSGSSESSGSSVSSSSSGSSESSSSSGEDSSSSSSSSSSGSGESSSSSSSSSSGGSDSSGSSGSDGSSSSSSSGGDDSSSSSSSSGGCRCVLTIAAFYNPETEQIYGTVDISCSCDCTEAGDISIFDDLGNATGEQAFCDTSVNWVLPAFYGGHVGELIVISAEYGSCGMSCNDSIGFVVPG